MGKSPGSIERKDPDTFAKLTGRSKRRVWRRLLLFTALVGVGLTLLYATVPGLLPSPAILIASLSRKGLRNFSGQEVALAMVGWALIGVVLIGYLAITASYRLAIRDDGVARYCADAGLRYVLDSKLRGAFSVHRYRWLKLVPDFELVEIDDLIVAPSLEQKLQFAEVTLKSPIGLGSHSYRVEFHGGLLRIDLTEWPHGGTGPPMGLRDRFRFEKNAEGWRAPGRMTVMLPGQEHLMAQIGRLADGWEAKSVGAALDEGVLYVAIAHDRDALPVPRFWRPGQCRAAYAQIHRDLAALLAVAEAAEVFDKANGSRHT